MDSTLSGPTAWYQYVSKSHAIRERDSRLQSGEVDQGDKTNMQRGGLQDQRRRSICSPCHFVESE